MVRQLLPFACLLLVFGCNCEAPTNTSCTSSAECPSGQRCLDARCVPMPDAAGIDGAVPCSPELTCAAGRLCCAEGEECVDGFQCLPVCANERCGDNGTLCCDAEQVCIDGVVCAADCAADQALCGAAFDVCCAAGDVCIDDACVEPGIECSDDFDCRDAALYCEPTIGRCLPTPTGVTCEVRPEFEQIELEQEWHWAGTTIGGTVWKQVISAPVVGDVSGDGVPDVVVPVYAGATYHDPVIVGLSGDDGHELFVIERTSGVEPEGEGLALANFDPSDDALELVYRLDAGGLRMMDGDGVTELAIRDAPNLRGTVEVADFNHDGIPDVVLGCRVYDGRDIADPTMDIITHDSCVSGGWEAPAIADLDGDGEPELTNGLLALNHDGTELWSGGVAGNTAVADLDLDGAPEIVVVGGGAVSVLNGANGATLIGAGGAWADGTFAIPGGGSGGPPTIADFDGDGLPEIATAGQEAYAVYDPDCLPTPPRSGGDACTSGGFIRWQVTTQDRSSSTTGSSVFDFQGDGVAEVIYNDECFLHIYDGRDGAEILMDPFPNTSRTGYEYPIVVDVDADGNSEIVVVANNDQIVRDDCRSAYSAAFGVPIDELPPEFVQGTFGVFVFGDPRDRWVPTRQIWNQYSYHVTNVTGTGNVPAVEMDNWTTPGLNNYRQNVQGSGIFNAPDLEVTLEAAGMCSAGSIALSALVRNAGSRGVPAGVPITFVRTGPGPEEVVGTAMTTTSLLPGGNERVTVTATDIPTDVDITYEARVDPPGGAGDPGAVIECDEADNVASTTDRCPGLL